MLFLDVRDSTGILQAVSAPEAGKAHARAERVRLEFVVKLSGELRLRKDPNPRMPTGGSWIVITCRRWLYTARTLQSTVHTGRR